MIDTSVLINLHASTYGARIIAALPNEVCVPAIVQGELEHETNQSNGENVFVTDLASSGHVRVITLSDEEYRVFEELTSSDRSLGDGEAATIAVAAGRGQLAVIDERKGRARAQERCGGLVPGWSLDLFRHPAVVAALGERMAIEALFLALRDARMRVHDEHCDDVVRLIGEQRAIECNSLPNYKTRSLGWRRV